MNLRQEILKEHSKVQCNKIVQWVSNDQKRFNELFHIFLNDDKLLAQRASWPLSNCVMAYPHLLSGHWDMFVKNLQRPGLHDAVKRNSTRLLQDIDIPERYQGTLMDICFKFVESPNEAVAIKAFSLTILGNLAKIYPDIIPEIKLLITNQQKKQTAAFKSRAKKVLMQFE